MSPLTEAQLAYVAAILDDRANLTSRTVRDTVAPKVDVNGGRVEVLRYLGALTGVRVVETKRSYGRAPCTEHCAGERHQHVVSASGRWSVSGAKATIVLVATQPYLVFRPAEVAALVDHGVACRFTITPVQEMAALGWPIPELWMEQITDPTTRRRIRAA